MFTSYYKVIKMAFKQYVLHDPNFVKGIIYRGGAKVGLQLFTQVLWPGFWI